MVAFHIALLTAQPEPENFKHRCTAGVETKARLHAKTAKLYQARAAPRFLELSAGQGKSS